MSLDNKGFSIISRNWQMLGTCDPKQETFQKHKCVWLEQREENTVEHCYNNIDLCYNSSISSDSVVPINSSLLIIKLFFLVRTTQITQYLSWCYNWVQLHLILPIYSFKVNNERRKGKRMFYMFNETYSTDL
jgi:hypothetical protein